MGGAGAGVINEHNILLSNPANLGAIKKIAFSSLLSFDFLRITDGSHHSNHVAAAPRELSFAFPLGIAGTIAFAVEKETDATIKYQCESALDADPASTFYGKLSYHRAGGVTGWRAGWGRNIGKWAYAGFGYERLYFEQNGTKIIQLIQFPANTTRDSTRISFRGHGLHLGIMVPVDKLVIGLSGRYVLKTDLSYSRGQYRDIGTAILAETDTTDKARIHMPPSATIGLSYEFSTRWLGAADMGIVAWNRYSSGGVLPASDINYAMSFGAGVRFIAAPELLAPAYWETIHYRAGIRISQLPRNDASEIALSLGAGLPLKGGGLLDLVISGGRRTDRDFTDYAENFAQFAIGVNGGRKWIRTATDGY